MRTWLALFLLILQLRPLSTAAICLLEARGHVQQACSQEPDHQQQGSSQDEQALSPQSHPHSPVQADCGPTGWCLTSWLLAGKKTAAYRVAVDPHDRVPLTPEAFLKSVAGSPPVPPPIL